MNSSLWKYKAIAKLPTPRRVLKIASTLEELVLKAKWTEFFAYRGENINVSFTRDPSDISNVIVGSYSYSSNPINVLHVSPDVSISIGRYCSIGQNVKFITSGFHDYNSFTNYGIIKKFLDSGDIKIGNDVWIGDDVTIMGGIQIADGSVIGTKSLVLDSTEPYGIYAGLPAELVKFRFESEKRSMLMASNWWDISLETLRTHFETLTKIANTNEFIEYINKLKSHSL